MGALAFLGPILLAHAFHVSKTMVEYKAQEKTLQVSVHLFIDDLETSLRKEGHTALFLCTDREAPRAEGLIEDYIRRHLQLRPNNREVTFTFLGKETSPDMSAVWIYLELRVPGKLRSLAIRNSLLMQAFDDQKNLVHVVGPGKKQGTFLFAGPGVEEIMIFGK